MCWLPCISNRLCNHVVFEKHQHVSRNDFFVGAHKHIPGKPEVNVVDLCMCMYMFDMVGTYIRM